MGFTGTIQLNALNCVQTLLCLAWNTFDVMMNRRSISTQTQSVQVICVLISSPFCLLSSVSLNSKRQAVWMSMIEYHPPPNIAQMANILEQCNWMFQWQFVTVFGAIIHHQTYAMLKNFWTEYTMNSFWLGTPLTFIRNDVHPLCFSVNFGPLVIEIYDHILST